MIMLGICFYLNYNWGKRGALYVQYHLLNFTQSEPVKHLGSSVNRKYKYQFKNDPANAWKILPLFNNSLNLQGLGDTGMVQGEKEWKAEDGCAW